MSQLQVLHLAIDELEAMRLCDLEGLDQRAAGECMGVSRGTVQRLLRSGRSSILRALLESSALMIDQGTDDETLHTNPR
jgi:predicted DNA-binding protein (UPF0251 family)